MASLRIGIAPLTDETGGGAYQYSHSMLGVLADLRKGREEELFVLADDLRPGDPLLGGTAWEIAPLTPQTRQGRALWLAKRLVRDRLSLRQRELIGRLRSRREGAAPGVGAPRRRDDVRRWLEQLGIGLVVYPSVTPIAFESGIPYVLAVHDLQHRRYPDLPEFGGDEIPEREYLFGNGIANATLVLVDSEIGKEDVLDFYGDLIAPDRVAVLPFLPGVAPTVTQEDRERVRRVHRLPERYLFYPAQLWPHKNHRLIVEALAELERTDGIAAELVLVGSKLGPIREQCYTELVARARELGVEGRIRFLGYVPAEDMPALYAEAVALAMPTLFGPTNIPVLEAWALDCPVITSDIRGVREQAGDAALLVDPESPDAMADAIRRVWREEDLRAELAARGRARLALYTRDDYAARLEAILDQAVALVGNPRERVGV
ncbi:MAG TPA: glycosyltransferase family 1 protein [Gaiellaceae bacterium]|nr:glycosyltransferase family 1 protein [Gaiellaceae bacterium]